jgi:hypothetical protein
MIIPRQTGTLTWTQGERDWVQACYRGFRGDAEDRRLPMSNCTPRAR